MQKYKKTLYGTKKRKVKNKWETETNKQKACNTSQRIYFLSNYVETSYKSLRKS